MRGRTTFVIAHRVSTVRAAHEILVLDRGRLAARGTHEQLLRSSPLYRETYAAQLQGEDEPGPGLGEAARDGAARPGLPEGARP
jgi:ABC-type transport system involved in cytochrome bd biosynthesis fused ATPase/permease subunit